MFKGKAIYNPSGKAGEYSYWACNFYTGCSNGCTYCYLKKGRCAKVLGSDVPKLKKCFKSYNHAYSKFIKEFYQNIDEIRKHGLFFSFTTDPMLPETISLTEEAMRICLMNNAPVKILTKRTDWINKFDFKYYQTAEQDIAFGFTITNYDSCEPNTCTNEQRYKALKKLHNKGFKTFVSLEPMFDFTTGRTIISKLIADKSCDLVKIGLLSGKKYKAHQALEFYYWLRDQNPPFKIYIKDSLSKLISPITTIQGQPFVSRSYNIFTDGINN
jgi:DNA repair photolyase